jgi:hypothetical protein
MIHPLSLLRGAVLWTPLAMLMEQQGARFGSHQSVPLLQYRDNVGCVFS